SKVSTRAPASKAWPRPDGSRCSLARKQAFLSSISQSQLSQQPDPPGLPDVVNKTPNSLSPTNIYLVRIYHKSQENRQKNGQARTRERKSEQKPEAKP
ncbi:hypothetical protein Tco_0208311, partial [Tanacetum coccineum]